MFRAALDELGFIWTVPKNMKFWRRELALADNTSVPDKEMYRVSNLDCACKHSCELI